MHPVLLLPLLFAQAAPPPNEALRFSRVEVALPGAGATVALDYLAVDRPAGRVWIPAGETASVDVLDLATRLITRIPGFAAGQGKPGAGPSAVSLGDGTAFIGNRADRAICAVEVRTLGKGRCVALSDPPDGVQYVPATREVWVTTPHVHAIAVVQAHALGSPAARLPLPGRPEGYALDTQRGRFFTNLEDKNQAIAIDVRTRKTISTWSVPCGADGPRGLAYDQARQYLFVACTDKVVVLDGGHDGAVLSTLQTGAGVDNLDYLDRTSNLYVAAGRAARLTVAHVETGGVLAVVASAPTAEGARVVVAAGDGSAVVGDPRHGRVLLYLPER